MIRVITGDCRDVLATMPAESVHCVVTSPPYFGLRDYGVAGQIGLEPTMEEYVSGMVEVFREVRRVLRSDGTLWLNLGDSYAATTRSAGASLTSTLATKPTSLKTTALRERGSWKTDIGSLKPKDLCGIPWRVAFALQADGWYLRQDIIWAKPNPMPESVTDRCTKSHEYMFLLTKSARYFYDAEAVKEGTTGHARGSGNHVYRYDGMPGHETKGGLLKVSNVAYPSRNKRSVWTVATEPFEGAHFAVMPTALIEPCILAGCPQDGTVLDPFAGAGTTGLVADRLQRNAALIELNPTYVAVAEYRIRDDAPLFFVGTVTGAAAGANALASGKTSG